MENGKLSYEELFDALRSLGYRDREVTIAGRAAILFEHPDRPRARITLPAVDPAEEVASMHVVGVRGTLVGHGLIREDPSHVLMDLIAASRPGAADR